MYFQMGRGINGGFHSSRKLDFNSLFPREPNVVSYSQYIVLSWIAELEASLIYAVERRESNHRFHYLDSDFLGSMSCRLLVSALEQRPLNSLKLGCGRSRLWNTCGLQLVGARGWSLIVFAFMVTLQMVNILLRRCHGSVVVWWQDSTTLRFVVPSSSHLLNSTPAMAAGQWLCVHGKYTLMGMFFASSWMQIAMDCNVLSSHLYFVRISSEPVG